MPTLYLGSMRHYDLVTQADIRRAPRSPMARNNNALKYIRGLCEETAGDTSIEAHFLYEFLSMEIRAPVYRRHKGPWYDSTGTIETWSWREMLNCMDDATLDDLVGDGIVNIWLGVLPNSYDQKRGRAEQLDKCPIYDFFLLRGNGTCVRFHVSQNDNKVEIADVPNFTRLRDLKRPEFQAWCQENRRGNFRKDVSKSYTRKGKQRPDERPCPPPSDKIDSQLEPATEPATKEDSLSPEPDGEEDSFRRSAVTTAIVEAPKLPCEDATKMPPQLRRSAATRPPPPQPKQMNWGGYSASSADQCWPVRDNNHWPVRHDGWHAPRGDGWSGREAGAQTHGNGWWQGDHASGSAEDTRWGRGNSWGMGNSWGERNSGGRNSWWNSGW